MELLFFLAVTVALSFSIAFLAIELVKFINNKREARRIRAILRAKYGSPK